MMTKQAVTLIAVAHPDDEILAFGGYMRAKAATEAFVIAYMTSHNPYVKYRGFVAPEMQLMQQARKATSLLFKDIHKQVKPEVDHVHCNIGVSSRLSHTVNLGEAADVVSALLDKYGAYRVLTHFTGDGHQDHRFVADAVGVACRAKPNRTIPELLTSLVPSSTELFPTALDNFKPTAYVSMDASDLAAKWRAMEAYEYEASADYRTKQRLETYASFYGLRCGMQYAEPYAVERLFL